MKVLDLQCGAGHVFEGWFASEDDFQGQLGRALVECPVCADTQVIKRLSAPRLNLGAAAERQERQEGKESLERPGRSQGQEVVSALPEALQAAWLKAVRHVVTHTEDVGERFADEARRIHYGETQDRAIRGQASREEAESLIDEGIAVLPLPLPRGLKGPVH